MTPRFHHRRARPLHEYRHGWYHLSLHRHGTRHRHTRGQRLTRPEQRSSSWRAVPMRIWPREIGRQIVAGVALALVVVFLGAVIFGVVAFLNARSDLSRAQNIARTLVHNRSELLSAAGRQRAAAQFAEMHALAARADATLNGSLAISLLKVVPILGHQVSGLTDAVHGVNELSQQGTTLLELTITAINASHGTSINLLALHTLDVQVHHSAHALTALETSPGGLWGPARSERIKLNEQLAKIVALLSRGGAALDFAQPFLGSNGPHTYLVAGQNTAEMRDQGAVLSWALLHVTRGTFTMTSAASVGTLTLRHPAVTITDAATRSAFGALEPTRIWQSVNANGDFPTSSRWMIAMLQRARGIKVDGVIGVDVTTLSKILKVVGSVHVADVSQNVNTHNVAKLLLFELYLKYPAGSQRARHDDITAVAQAAVHKMNAGHYDLGAFFQSLARSSQGRHLLLYDTDPKLEQTVRRFGGSGALRPDGPNSVHLAIEAGVAAKIDWFIHSTVTYDVRIDSHGTAYVTTTVALHNSAPLNAKPSYALGPDRTNSHVAGEYIARMYEWLPKGFAAPGAITEEHLSLERAVQPVFASQTQEVIFSAIKLNAVQHGRFVLNFIPQGLIHASNITVNFTSSGNYSGPAQSTWLANKFVTLKWHSSL
jgi:hypothetical protein